MRGLAFMAAAQKKDPKKAVTIKEICAKEGISHRYLENIFVNLRKAGLVKSSMGEYGGFKLAKKPGKIKILDILTAVETKKTPSRCVTDINMCKNSNRCSIRKIWINLHENNNRYLSKVTLTNIMKAGPLRRKTKV
jgi:Rrf2 family protein